MTSSICVVGSSNIDMNSYVPRFPQVGETLHGHSFTTGYGGKGANQAVMAARLGGRVAMVAKVGDDIFGSDMLENFRAQGIDTRFVRVTDAASSGVAVITIDDAGDNMIVVIPGANGLLTPDDVAAAREVVTGAQILVCQMEVPMESNLAALRLAREAGVMTLFNPAPAVPELPGEVYALSDIFCPNETEAALLTGLSVTSRGEAVAAGRALLARGARRVLLTLGEQGSLLVTPDEVTHVPAPAVTAVDSTGAGDAFMGSLAFFLGAGLDLPAAMERANHIAALSVQKPGTQASYPAAADLPPELLAAG